MTRKKCKEDGDVDGNTDGGPKIVIVESGHGDERQTLNILRHIFSANESSLFWLRHPSFQGR